MSLPPVLGLAVSLGGSGIFVYFFFSGYGLARSSASNWLTFWRKRFIKVLVPYYVALVLIFAVIRFVPIYSVDGLTEYLSHFLLYKMFFLWYTRNLGEHLWFVSTIVQFYLALPLLLRWQSRVRPGRFILGVFLTSLAYSSLIVWLGVDWQRIWFSFFLQYVWVYGLGMAVSRESWLAAWIARPWFIYVGLAALAGVVVILLARYFGSLSGLFNDYFMFLVYASALVLLYRLSCVWTPFQRFIRWVESFSYSLYLTHILVFDLYRYFLHGRALLVLDVLIIALLAVGVAIVFQKFTDRILQLPLFQTDAKAIPAGALIPENRPPSAAVGSRTS